MRRVMVVALFGAALAAAPARADGPLVAPLGPPVTAGPVPCLQCPPIVRPGCPPVGPSYPYYPQGVLPGLPPVTDPNMPPDPNRPPVDPNRPPIDPNTFNPQATDPLVQATRGGGQSPASYNPAFNGDFGGVFYYRNVTVTETFPPATTRVQVGTRTVVIGSTETVTLDMQGNKIVTTTPITRDEPVYQDVPIPGTGGTTTRTVKVQLPLAGRYNGIMITDNDGPRPTDRVYFGYNYYNEIGVGLGASTTGNTDMQRQSIGFEKTFLNENASFGMRLPFIQQYGVGPAQNVGDLTLLFKYAWVNDRQTGNVVSTGFAVTTPTGGGGAVLIDGTAAPHSWLFQPWAGFIQNFDRFYVVGLSNMIIPSISRDVTLWGNSLAAGYWLYRSDGDRLLTGIIPVVEAHCRTPLSNRNPDDVIFLQDQLNITTGVHFRTNRGILSPAVCVPLLGPRPYTIEAMCYATWTF